MRIIKRLALTLGIFVFILCLALALGSCRNISYVTNEHTINEDIESIKVYSSTADIVIQSAEDGKGRVVCYEDELRLHTVTEEDGCLEIKEVDMRGPENFLGIGIDKTSITIYLPEGE